MRETGKFHRDMVSALTQDYAADGTLSEIQPSFVKASQLFSFLQGVKCKTSLEYVELSPSETLDQLERPLLSLPFPNVIKSLFLFSKGNYQ